MAEATIRIKDTEDGTVSVAFEFDPPIIGKQKETTPALCLTGWVMEFINDRRKKEGA